MPFFVGDITNIGEYMLKIPVFVSKFISRINSTMQKSFLFALLSIPIVANAAANLMVTPKRVVFEGSMRTAQVTLVNQGDETGEFRISFLRQNMTESGQFVAVEDDEKGMFSDQMLRYSPRQITLPPGQSQVVRLMLRKPRDLASGEYRSHMLFQTLPKSTKGSLERIIDSEQKGISVEITPLIGISIPVIVRHGKLEGNIQLQSAQLVSQYGNIPKPHILLEMQRSGNKSVYGDFRAVYIPKNGTEKLTIGVVNGVAVYTPNTLRSFAMPLNIPQSVSLKDGRIRIIFLESGKDEKTGLLAETEISLQ